MADCLGRYSAQHHPDITGTAGENPLQCNMILLADTSKQKFGSFHAKGKISPWTICWGLKLTWQHSQQDLHQKLQRNSRSALLSSQPWRPHRSCSRLECESQNCFSAANLLLLTKEIMWKILVVLPKYDFNPWLLLAITPQWDNMCIIFVSQ